MADDNRDPEPVQTLHLFGPERAALLDVLAGLSREEWNNATICPGWSVKDLAAHLVGDDLGIVSRWRDDERAGSIAAPSWADLVAAINERNEVWVDALRRLSPAVILDLLRWTAEPTVAALARLDRVELAGAVSWAGPEPAPGWLHVAREFTERWHHQQQIREAAGARTLDDPQFLGPVLETFARALPRAYAGLDAPAGTELEIVFTGPAGSAWTLLRDSAAWRLLAGRAEHAAAVVRVDQDAAWRLFTRGLRDGGAAKVVEVDGDERWRKPILSAVAIIA